MHRTLSGCPCNNSPHNGSIRKPNQCEVTQLIHNVIHTPSPDPTAEISSQAKNAEIFLKIHSSLISIGQLYEDECIVTFDKHKLRVGKNKDKIIEGYQDPTNGLWCFPSYHPPQNNKQYNMLEKSTSKHCCQHVIPLAPRHPKDYCPTSQQDLANFITRSSAAPKNTPWSRQLRMEPSQHSQDS